MSNGTTDYNWDIAETIHGMYEKGVNDPSHREITIAHFARMNGGVERELGGEIFEGIRKRLTKVARILESDFGYMVCPLNGRYYVATPKRKGSFRTVPPTDKVEAKLCLPIGQGMNTRGLWLCKGEDNPIYQAYLELGANAGFGRIKRVGEKINHATRSKAIPSSTKVAALTSARGVVEVLNEDAA